MGRKDKDIKNVYTPHKLNSREDLTTEFIYGFEAGEQSALSNQWVNIDERKPQDNDEVLVTYTDNLDRICFGVAWIKGGKYCFWFSNDDDVFLNRHKITHWMPIPPLPETEG